MKLKIFLSLIIISIFFSACLIKSLYPFYMKDDVIFDQSILGNWLDKDSTNWNFSQFKTEKSFFNSKDSLHNAYLLNHTEKDGENSLFYLTLFTLNGNTYFDFYPQENITEKELLSLHFLPFHTLAKVEELNEQHFVLKWFNEEWLAELIEAGQLDVQHELLQVSNQSEDKMPVLTASTAELQKFIIKHADDPGIFKCNEKYTGDDYCVKLGKVRP